MRTCKDPSAALLAFASLFVSLFAGIFASLFFSIFASLFASIIANNKSSLTASIIASQLCLMLQRQELCYSLQQDQGKFQFQPDHMMIQLMSLLTLKNKQEKEEMHPSVCRLICSFGISQIIPALCCEYQWWPSGSTSVD